MVFNSDNIQVIVRTIINIDLNVTHSILGGNWRHLRSKYGMEECNVEKVVMKSVISVNLSESMWTDKRNV